MAEPTWLTRLMLDTIHAELIAEHGGVPGVRVGGDALLESALARPQHKRAYDAAADLATLAAAYLFALVKNHSYLDGNKRVGFAAAATFALLNGARLTASEADAYAVVIAVAEGSMEEAELAAWFRDNLEPLNEGS